jgi:hypothetical protein
VVAVAVKRSPFGGWVVLIAVGIFLFVFFQMQKEDSMPSSSPSTSTSTSKQEEILNPGSRLRTTSFEIWVPSTERTSFTRKLGTGYSTKEVQDAGTYFCLVPVCIRNRSNETESLVGISWYLYTAGDTRFETASGADYYLRDTERLDAIDIPPSITRCGKLVFLVTEVARSTARLTLKASGWSFKGYFRIPK